MLKDIEIQNFRCFENSKISGFQRVNLIGGKNNSGKTALLEALLLNEFPRPQSAVALKRIIRRESSEFIKKIPERAWDYFFFNENKKEIIKILGRSEDDVIQHTEISVDESISKDFFDNLLDTEEEESQKLLNNFLSTNSSVISTLNFKVTSNNKEPIYYSLTASSRGLMAKEKGIPDSRIIPIIPSCLRASSEGLKNAYDKARLDYKDSEILNAFKILDPSIKIVEGLLDTLYLTREGQSRLPLSLFGDAINRVADIILRLINNENKILLIDEIENGIHYTNQRDFWKNLFRLAIELDTQIFATTHSLEMIQAFADVSLGQYEGCDGYTECGAYFELARHFATGKIVGIRRDPETLNYAIERGKGVRGE